MKNYFTMKNDFGTDWYLPFEKITTFGIDAGNRFWIRCDSQEYGTHDESKTQFDEFKKQFDEFLNPAPKFKEMKPND